MLRKIIPAKDTHLLYIDDTDDGHRPVRSRMPAGFRRRDYEAEGEPIRKQ